MRQPLARYSSHSTFARRSRSLHHLARLALWLSFASPLALSLVAQTPSAAPPETLPERSGKTFLHRNWQLQSSAQIKSTGAEISTVGFDASSWHHSDIPATVFAALVADKTYPDPTYATNLKSVPGMDYSDASFFALQDMPADSPFRFTWWYRTEFTAPAATEQKIHWLHFLGINYRANIWLNGQKIADAQQVAGTYRTFEFDVTKYLKPGQPNSLALEITAPGKNDLGITWVDWNPTPPDKNMGIWKEVFLTDSSDVSVRNPFVSSKLDASYKNAFLTVSADLHNASDHPVDGVLRAEIDGSKINQPVTLAAGESKTISLTPENFNRLQIPSPRLWWPYTVGKPNLYNAKISFLIADKVSDSASTNFGIREVTSELTEKGGRLFKINGKNILIRGAAWAPDMLFRWSSSRLDTDLAYVRDMGLNTIRLEGRLDREEFFEKTDRLGILVMPGWTCCDAWEKWANWKQEQHEVSAESLKSQIRILRQHPSVFVWLNGSDNPPPADVEKTYLAILKNLGWPNPSVSSASEQKASFSGKSGVKMTGPYEYVPPVYWLTDTKAGGAYGYNTETSPGPAIPVRESLEKFIPKDHLWPVDQVWNYHAGKERFTTINVFSDGLTRRYGAATSLDDFLRKSQAVTYDGQRAMFEAYGRNKYTSTGVIQWMLNNGWPSLIWHLYDYYMLPAGGYYGTKKACEPVHVQYSYDDNSVSVVNSTYQSFQGMKVIAKTYSLDASEKNSKDSTLDIAPDSSTKAFDLPKIDGLSKTYFLRLQLRDSKNVLVSDNFYWLSTKPDTLDWSHKVDTVYTPQKDFGDLTGLATLPDVALASAITSSNETGRTAVHISLRNSSPSVAFMIHLRLLTADGATVAPAFFDDNYFSLLPGDTREVYGHFDPATLAAPPTSLTVEGFNITPNSLPIPPPPAPTPTPNTQIHR